MGHLDCWLGTKGPHSDPADKTFLGLHIVSNVSKWSNLLFNTGLKLLLLAPVLKGDDWSQNNNFFFLKKTSFSSLNDCTIWRWKLLRMRAHDSVPEAWEILSIFHRIDLYIPRCKHKVKHHSLPWFSATCAAAIIRRNQFFRLYLQNKSSGSKEKFRRADNRCKRVLEAAEVAYANKTKESITSQKLVSQHFWWIANKAYKIR